MCCSSTTLKTSQWLTPTNVSTPDQGHLQSQCCSGWEKSLWDRQAACMELLSQHFLQHSHVQSHQDSQKTMMSYRVNSVGYLRNLLMTGRWLLWSFRYSALNPSKDTRMRGGLEKLGRGDRGRIMLWVDTEVGLRMEKGIITQQDRLLSLAPIVLHSRSV